MHKDLKRSTMQYTQYIIALTMRLCNSSVHADNSLCQGICKETLMINLSSFIAWKYLTYSHKESNITFMTRICFLGITIGTFALMLTLIITNGFEKAIGEKMQGITSEVLVYSPNNKLDVHSIKQYLSKHFGTKINAMAASSLKQIIIDYQDRQTVLILKGIEPVEEAQVSSLNSKITLPSTNNSLAQLLNGPQLIIGHKCAATHNLHVGDQLSLLVPENGSKKKILLSDKKATIAGIFKVGLEEYDNNLAICSLSFFSELFEGEEGVDSIALALAKPTSTLTDSLKPQAIVHKFYQSLPFVSYDYEKEIALDIQASMPQLTVSTWKDLYPGLASSLKLEKYAMFFVLALITLVAAMNMISLLFMQIQQKRRDIAIAQSMGMHGRTLSAIFLQIGMLITLFAAVTGLGLAAAAGYCLERYPFIELPDVYYISYLPARMELDLFIVVFICTMLLGFIATWIPARRAQRISITHVLRHD